MCCLIFVTICNNKLIHFLPYPNTSEKKKGSKEDGSVYAHEWAEEYALTCAWQSSKKLDKRFGMEAKMEERVLIME